MKRVLFALALLVFPLSAMALTPISDSALSDVTGQSGVNINVDLAMDVNIGTMAWGDANGLAGLSSTWNTAGLTGGGYVGVKNFNITNLVIKSRETETWNGYHSSANWKPVTIDVVTATGTTGVAGYGNGVTFVRFGLGALEIQLQAMSLVIALGDGVGGTPNLTQELGTAYLGAIGVYINPASYVDIYTKMGNVGVNLAMNVTIDKFTMNYLSWGDSDGMTGATTDTALMSTTMAPGYVGIRGLDVGPITIAGTVSIDVNTSASGGLYNTYAAKTQIAGGPVSVVHIGFRGLPDDTGAASWDSGPGFKVMVAGPITGEIRTGDNSDLITGNYGIMGNFYLSQFNLNVHNGSWVDIWAH